MFLVNNFGSILASSSSKVVMRDRWENFTRLESRLKFTSQESPGLPEGEDQLLRPVRRPCLQPLVPLLGAALSPRDRPQGAIAPRVNAMDQACRNPFALEFAAHAMNVTVVEWCT